MARIELPESRLRIRRRRRRVRLIVLSVALVLLVLAGLVGLTYVPFLQLQTVEVSGAHTLSTSTIDAFVRERLVGRYWWVFPKSNIFLYPRQQIQADLLAAYPMLASADARFAPSTALQNLAVTLVERQPRALWCKDAAGCYFMDENGVVYAEAPSFSSPVYVPYFGGSGRAPWQFLTPQQFVALSALVDAIARYIPAEQLESVSVDDAGDVRMRFASGFTILSVLDDAGGDIFERFSLALTAEPFSTRSPAEFEYLDLRFGDKLYYKLKTK